MYSMISGILKSFVSIIQLIKLIATITRDNNLRKQGRDEQALRSLKRYAKDIEAARSARNNVTLSELRDDPANRDRY
jgi:hypothetical protein